MNKELKRMNRGELLELLITQIEENEKLSEQLDEAREKLEQKELTIHNAGTLAEAALRLNKVFEAADAAVSQYTESIKKMHENGETVIVEPAFSFNVARLEEDNEPTSKEPIVSVENCEQVKNAQRRAQEIIAEAEEKAKKIIKDADKYWEQTKIKARALLNNK